MAETEAAQQEAMARWDGWFGSRGAAGYSILEAADLDAAVARAAGGPIVADGGTVDVYEAIDVGP